MKAVEQIPEQSKRYVEELDFLRLVRAQEESKLAGSTITDLQLRQQITMMKMNICDLSKQNLQAQLKELQVDEKRAYALRENLDLHFKTTADVEFRKKYEVPEKTRYEVDPLTRELKYDLPN